MGLVRPVGRKDVLGVVVCNALDIGLDVDNKDVLYVIVSPTT